MKFDAFIIRKIQETYLWIYDWTGVYAATVGTIAIITGSIGIGIRPMQLFFMCINILILIPYYLDQDKANYTKYNIRAMQLQESWLRIGFSNFFIVLMIIELIELDFWMAVNSFTLMLYVNMTAVCIREREPKEWFKKSKLAYQESP